MTSPHLQPIDLDHIDPDDLEREYISRGADQVSDAQLVDGVAAILAVPRFDPPDSFVLHAPLELLARAALLPHVSPGLRDAARVQIVSIAARFQDAGPPAESGADDGLGAEDALDLLVRALAEGDLESAAMAGGAVGRAVDADVLSRALGDLVAASLAAAAHAPIFLHHLPRAAPRSPLAGTMLATMARELARHPDWRLSWMDDDPPRGSGDLARALVETPVLGLPESTFIHPLMTQAESSGLAAAVIGGAVGSATDLDLAARSILRVATASMLLDDPAHAPYGWSHCLTIPQGLLSAARNSADPARMIAIAATHVVGFRAGEGSAPLATLGGPGGRVGDDALLPALEAPHLSDLQRAIDHAASHEDAHLTKYVVSCLDAARVDPVGAPQHLHAAIHLSDWWRTSPEERASTGPSAA